MEPRVVCTVEARMRSTRLPGKVLKEVCGKPLLELMVERLRRCRKLDDIVIATADHSSCDPIESLAARIGVKCFRGSEEDVLGRVLGAAASAGADVIVEMTGDCPLIDPAVVDTLVEAYHAAGVDYCANVLKQTYPGGMDTQVFGYRVLERVAGLTKEPDDREHVSLFIYRHPEIFSLHNVESGLPASMTAWRLVVDTPEDFELIRRIFEALYPARPDFDLAAIRGVLEANPGWLDLNRHLVKGHS